MYSSPLPPPLFLGGADQRSAAAAAAADGSRRCRAAARSAELGYGMAAPAACTRFSDNYDLKEELGK